MLPYSMLLSPSITLFCVVLQVLHNIIIWSADTKLKFLALWHINSFFFKMRNIAQIAWIILWLDKWLCCLHFMETGTIARLCYASGLMKYLWTFCVFSLFSSCQTHICQTTGGRVKTWKRRWFILTDNCLYYFEYTTVS